MDHSLMFTRADLQEEPAYTCSSCRALVSSYNTDAHAEWHEALHLSLSRKVDGYTESEKPKRQRRKYTDTEINELQNPG